MPIREVIEVPDPRLKNVASRWEGNAAETKALAIDLFDTMRSFPGCVGLAAPQIGEPWRAVIVDVSGHKKARSCHGLLILFNPEVIRADGAEVAREGCLSVPDFTANITRATQIVVSALTLDGERVIEADAFEARAILHEIDHLDGKLFLDRVSSRQTDVFRRKTYQ
ncbi:MAG: peptide deformylase [Candidatus Sericytochromatia bacterium]|nr:peptide deformylase [Candidatus Sericytochromatia bacterium]